VAPDAKAWNADSRTAVGVGGEVGGEPWAARDGVGAAPGLLLFEEALERAWAVPAARQSEIGPSFVEFSAPCASGLREWVIDFENPAGASMRVHMKGGDALHVAALASGFWKGE